MERTPEFCFLWITHWSTCMTKAEWSGWVQAIGTILAIGGAFYFGERQLRKQVFESRRLEANKRQLDDLLKTEIVHHLFTAADTVVQMLSAATLPNPMPPIWAALRRAGELATAFRELPPFELPGKGVAFGALQAPGLLMKLKDAAQACVDERVRSKGNAQSTLPSRMEMTFNNVHSEASKFFLAGRLTTADQIRSLKTLTGVT